MVPNCHHYHLRCNLYRCIAQLSSCSDSNVQQTRLAQKDLPVVVFIIMALIATRDFNGVSSKWIGEIVNSCIDDQEIKAHTLKRDMIMNFLRESVFEACLSSFSLTLPQTNTCLCFTNKEVGLTKCAVILYCIHISNYVNKFLFTLCTTFGVHMLLGYS